MRRIWIEPQDIPTNQQEFEILGDAFHHAVQVSRFRLDEEFEIVCGADHAIIVKLIEIKKKTARVAVLRERPLVTLQKPYVKLAIGVTKWAVFEEILEKGVELGVHSVQPLITDFSFIRSVREWPEGRTERFMKIVKSATEQSGRGPLMRVEEPTGLPAFTEQLNRNAQAAGLFAYEGRAQLGVREALGQIKSKPFQEIWGVVGPAGGFSESEVRMMRDKGYPPVTMGPLILRAETACFAIISVIKYELAMMEA